MALTLDDARVFAGTGGRPFDPALPTVALLHGAGMDHTVFAQQARALAHRGRNVLAFDLPGHGRSAGPPLESVGAMADWVLAAATRSGAQRIRLAGHSMGALVALEAAARGGSRVEALALIGVVPEMRVHPDLLAAAREGRHETVELMTGWSFGATGQLGASRTPGLFLPGAALRLLERAPMPTLAADLAACDAYRGAAAAAGKLRCPALLLLGGEDRMTPPARGRELAALIAKARIAELPEAGHMMMLEEPVAALKALQAIL
ncbi:MAG TPA: alpha/beta hydrolase [Stellaceae bacterium]|nr:alpha/beta hydrolase [Stellaceae bacterium]